MLLRQNMEQKQLREEGVYFGSQLRGIQFFTVERLWQQKPETVSVLVNRDRRIQCSDHILLPFYLFWPVG